MALSLRMDTDFLGPARQVALADQFLHASGRGGVETPALILSSTNLRDGMLQVTNHDVGVRLAGLTQKGHKIYAHHTTAIGECLERTVGSIPRHIDQCAATRASDCHWRRGAAACAGRTSRKCPFVQKCCGWFWRGGSILSPWK